MAQTKLPMNDIEPVLSAMAKEIALIKDPEGRHLPTFTPNVLKILCQLASYGINPSRIANQLGIPRRSVICILRSESCQREVARLQSDLKSRSDEAFAAQLPEAMTTVFKIMKSKGARPSNQLMAAGMIMDRALGKPTQKIEQQTTLLKEVLIELSKRDDAITDAQIVPSASEPGNPSVKLPSEREPGDSTDGTPALDPLEDLLR